MKFITMYCCEYCGRSFYDEKECIEHESCCPENQQSVIKYNRWYELVDGSGLVCCFYFLTKMDHGDIEGYFLSKDFTVLTTVNRINSMRLGCPVDSLDYEKLLSVSEKLKNDIFERVTKEFDERMCMIEHIKKLDVSE